MREIPDLPRDMPQYSAEVPLYEVSKHRTYSPRIKEVRAELDERVERYKKLFEMRGELRDYGTQVEIKDGSKILEIYRPSDSVRWRDVALAGRDTIPNGAVLPEEKEAQEIARRYLMGLRIELDKMKISSVVPTSIYNSESNDKKRSVISNTEVNVNFSYFIDKYPVIGPGAKLKISIIEDGNVSKFLRFWREPNEVGKVNIVHPEDALKMHADTLSRGSSTINTMQFGYYATPPFEFLRFLIPVYETRGIGDFGKLGKRGFVTYLPAIELNSEDIKKGRFAGQHEIDRVLPSAP